MDIEMFLYAVPVCELLYDSDVRADFSVIVSHWLYLDYQVEKNRRCNGGYAGFGRTVTSLCGITVYKNSGCCDSSRICSAVYWRTESRKMEKSIWEAGFVSSPLAWSAFLHLDSGLHGQWGY